MATSPENTYRPASTLALFATLLFVAGAVFSAVAALVTLMQIQLLEAVRFGGVLTPGQAEAQDNRQRFLAAVGLAGGIPTSIVFLAWVYRANRNARALGAAWMRYGPVWSVGCFFIPIVSLYAPYLVVREIWRASLPGPGGQPRAPASPLLGAWWATWVVGGFIQYSRMRALFGGEGLAFFARLSFMEAGRVTAAGLGWLDHLVEHSWGLLVGDVVGVAGSVLAAAVVIRIADLQERRRAGVADPTAPEAVPPY
jgi:hypothetical protein